MKPTRLRKPGRELLVLEVVLGDLAAPNARYVPGVGKTSPSSTFSSVDLPQPFAPSSATFSPGATSNETPSSAGNRSR